MKNQGNKLSKVLSSSPKGDFKVKKYLLIAVLLTALLFAGCQKTDETITKEPPSSVNSNGQQVDERLSTEVPAEWSKVVIAYEKEGCIMLAKGDNQPQALTEGPGDTNPRFSPDGNMILFERHPGGPDYWLTSYDLWVVHEDGSSMRPLATQETLRTLAGYSEGEGPAQLLAADVSWIENGAKIAFRTRYIVEIHEGYYDDLWLADLVTGEITNLLPDGMGGNYAFSPDGTKLLVADHESVSIMEAEGTNRQLLISFPRIYSYESLYNPLPLWSPDSSYALVAIPFEDAFTEEQSAETASEPENATIWKIYLDGQVEELLKIFWPGMEDFHNGQLFSPDKHYLLNATKQDDTFISQIVSLKGEVGNTFEQTTRILGWSTDSSKLIALTDGLVLVDTGGPQKPIEFLEDDIYWYALVKWVSPSSFLIRAEESANLYLADINGRVKLIDSGVCNEWFSGQFDFLLLD